MNPAYSVILFTTLSGAGYGLLALIGLTGAAHGPASSFAFGATALGLALGLVTVGLLASMLHLGHPERAWRAFSQWRTSWLSREGVAAVATYIPALVFAWAWLDPAGDRRLIAAAGLLAAAMSGVTVVCTAMIYASLRTIRHWHHWLVVPVYLLLALATGAVLLFALASLAGRPGIPALGVITVAALVLAGLAKALYWWLIDRDPGRHTMAAATGLGPGVRQWEVPHTAENFVTTEMGYRVARRHAARLRLIALAGLALAALSVLAAFAGGGALAMAASLVAVAAATVAVLVERWLFFAEAQHLVTLYYGAPRA